MPDAVSRESATNTSPPLSPSGTVATFVDDRVVSVRLLGEPGEGKRETLLDVLDASNEEPFTLESYETLILEHAKAGKDFIIARVTTVDPLDQTRMYHSHYAAHQLNKILFRTQPHQGLLHRMKAKNPLNNMPIVGDVLYYAIKTKSVSLRMRDAKIASTRNSKVPHHFESPERTEITATAPLEEGKQKTETRITIDTSEPDVAESVPKVPPTAMMRQESSHIPQTEPLKTRDDTLERSVEIALPEKAFQPPEACDTHSAQPESPTSVSHERSSCRWSQTSAATIAAPCSPTKHPSDPNLPSPTSPTSTFRNTQALPNLSYDARFFATDEGFLMRSATRHYFKLNALDPADAQLFPVSSSSPLAGTRQRSTNPILGTPPTTRLEWMIEHNGMRNGSAESLSDVIVGNSMESRRLSSHRGRRRCDMYTMCYNRRLKWMLLLYVLFGFLMIRFVVSQAYAYLVAFLLMLGLFLAFCIGSGFHATR